MPESIDELGIGRPSKGIAGRSLARTSVDAQYFTAQRIKILG